MRQGGEWREGRGRGKKQRRRKRARRWVTSKGVMGWRTEEVAYPSPASVPRLLRNGAINAEWSLFSTSSSGSAPRYPVRTGLQVLQFRANETIPRRSFVTTGCDCRPIKVDSLQMDWKASGKPHSPVDGTCAYTGGANFPRLFRWILDGIQRNAVINYHSFVPLLARSLRAAVIIWNIGSFRRW